MKKYFILLFSILLVACQATESPTGNVVGNGNNDQVDNGNTQTDTLSRQELVRDFVETTPTYEYDGSELRFVDMSDGELDTYTFSFVSANTGYGNREDKVSFSRNVEHEIVVTLNGNVITSAITDGYWNEMTDSVVSRDFVTMKYEPVQCEDTPWQLWYEYNQALGQEPDFDSSQEALIERYYELTPDTTIRNVQMVRRAEATCQSCNVCLKSFYYTLDVDTGYSAQELIDDGWDYLQPLSKAEINDLVRNWIIKLPTFKNGGNNLQEITVFIDNISPQRVVATYGFRTTNGGYGVNNIQAEDGMNEHVIRVVVESGVVTQAIIDNKWDSINQELIG